jgi:5-hydroxyisourate hydrolase-like protein (transthyretin family)
MIYTLASSHSTNIGADQMDDKLTKFVATDFTKKNQDTKAPLTVHRTSSGGKYVIKNRAEDIFWNAGHNPIQTVFFLPQTMEGAKMHNYLQVNELSPSIEVFRG